MFIDKLKIEKKLEYIIKVIPDYICDFTDVLIPNLKKDDCKDFVDNMIVIQTRCSLEIALEVITEPHILTILTEVNRILRYYRKYLNDNNEYYVDYKDKEIVAFYNDNYIL